MAKQLNVNLAFKAETGQAKQAIMDLQSALSKVASMNINTPGLDANKLKAASSAAKELSIHLNNAFNAETGNFDLSKLDRSLKTSSTNVTELSSKLLGAGSSGEQAFVKLAQSIAAADRPVVTLNSKLSEMLTTLKNTARWQISSSILHGFMGAVQQAYGYAQDLNESLTNIRIVTGQNIEQMSKFAVEANKAAKALSTTTTEYTNASLIYYQQGLSDAEVAKRTEVTIKMANAAGQSAQIVSDQLTAVWNNFYDGSKSLEYYADVMTALGAATASSTDEIAGGLEKFAAIGETIGLSYEYAASALATITSNTRQSEEVVGTALKTIFARIQGLNLGETLDDGTTLNKYSQALQSVGINIFDQAGELKNMDNILDEMADKWDTLSKAQQAALAQTVAGTRQYTQLIALMDNWDNGDSDSMTANLDTAYNSTGALQEQADIYAESWEAARDRITASLETIYNQLLDDDFFIDISNGFAGLLDSVSAFIDGIGGVKTILIAIGSIFLSSVANKIQPALMNLKHSFSVVFQSAEKQAQSLATEMNKGIQDTLGSEIGKGFNDSNQIALKNAMALNNAKAKLQAVENGLNDSEKQRANLELSMIQMQQQETQEVADRITKLKQEKEAILDIAATETLTAAGQKTYGSGSKEMDSYVSAARQEVQNADTDESVDAAIERLTDARQAASQYQTISEQIISSISDIDNAFRSMGSGLDLTPSQQQLQQLNDTIQASFKDNLTDIKINLTEVGNSATGFESIRNQLDLLINSMPSVISQSEAMQDALTDVFTAKTPEQMEKAIKKIEQALESTTIDTKQFAKVLKEINPKRFKELQENADKTSRALKELEEKQNAVNRAVQQFNPQHMASKIESITKAAAGFGQVAMAAQSLRSIFQAWNNDDLSFGEKLTTTLTGISMIIPAVLGGYKSLSAAAMSSTAAQMGLVAAAEAYSLSQAKNVAAMTTEQIMSKMKVSSDTAELILMRAKTAALGDNITAMTAEQVVEKTGMTLDQAKNVLSALSAGATMKEALAKAGLTAAEGGLTVAKGAGTLATIAQTVANWALQASMSPVLLITLLLVAAIALLVGAIAGVVALVNAATKAYNADAIAAENAATAAKNLGEAYNECKQEYQDMISAMENYQSARDALDDLTKGTEEYRQALKEANRQALELINQYGLIEGQDYEWQGDELVIKDSAMSRVRAEKEDEVDKAYAASQMASAEAQRTKAIADQTALRREMRDDVGLGDGDKVWGAIANGVIAGVGAALAPVTGGLSLLATGAAFANQGLMEQKSQAYNAAIDKAIEEGKTNANLFDTKEAMAEALELDDQDIIDALWANRDSLEQLSADMNAAAQAEKLAAQNAANEIMSESGYDKTEAGKMALEAGGEIYQQMYGDAYDKYLADAKDRGLFNTGTDASKAAFEEYAKQAGLDQLKNFKVTNYKGDGTVEYKYIDEQGQEQTALATAEEIAATLAAADAANQLEGALSELRSTITDLNNSTDLGDHALAEFLSTGNLEGATKAEYEDLYADVGASRDAEGNLTYDAAKLDSVLGLTGNTEADLALAKSRGYESADAYRQAFIDSLDIEWEVPTGIGEDIAGSLTVGAANKIQSTFEAMGEQGGDAFVKTINGIASGADWEALAPEDQTAMLEKLANIDWTSWDAGEQAIAIAEEYGIAIDGTTQSWQENINAMRDAANALPDLEAMRQEFEQIKEITADIDLGSILSEEDYEILVNYNKELEKYFTILSDGSAQFTGDKLDFQQAIEQQHTEELLEAIQVYKDRNKEITAQIEAGANAVGGEEKLDSYRDTENYVGDDGKNHYSGSNVNRQLDFLESQGYDSDQLAAWREDLADGGTTVNVLEDIANAVNSTADSFNNLGAEAESNKALIQGMMNEIALSADDAEERAKLLESGIINEDAFNAAAMAAHNEEKWEDMDPDEVEKYADSLMEAAEASDLLSDELKDNEEAAEDVALYTKKMNKGIEALSEGFEEWSDILKNSDKASEEYSEAMDEMKTAMSDVLGVSEDFLSDSFILQNMEDIKLAAEGDAEAIDRLAIAAAQDILINIDFADEELRNKALTLHSDLATMLPNIEVGATLTGEDEFLQKAQEIVAAAGMTAEQANAYFRAMGFETKFATVEQPVEQRVPITYTKSSIVEAGIDWSTGAPYWTTATSSWQDGYDTYTGKMDAIAMSTDGTTPQIESITRTNAGSMNNSSSSNKGGSSSSGGGGSSNNSSKTADKRQRKSEVVDPYKEINDQLEKTQHLMSKNNTLAEGLWGAARSKKMRDNIALQKQEIALLEDKLAISEEQMGLSYGDLTSSAAVLGLNLEIDSDGIVTNIVDIQEEIWKEREALLDSFGNEMSEDEQEQLDAFDQYIENFTNAYDEYESHRLTSMETEEAILEAQLEAQQIMFDDLNQTLDENISLIEKDLELVEYYLSKVEDDFFGMAEAAALMVGSLSSANPGEGGQLGAYLDTLEAQKKYKEELDAAYANGDINQAQYIEGLMNCQSATIEALQSLNELDKTMKGYYGETLAAAQEELSKYTDMMEHHSEVLEHYSSLLELIGKSKDWERMKTVFEAQVEVAENAAAVSKANYEMLAQEAADKKAAWDALNKGLGDELTYEESVIKQQWLDAQAAADEAQNQMLEDAAAWAESLKSLLETELAELADILNESLSGEFGSLDNMMTAMERANSLQEEYLTTTNQVYETNKLMHTAQQEIDKTTNSVAKRRLKQYIDETEQLQNKNKLSQFELDIQKAKYDLLVAEIALEEAQQAKSTVRLQRDSEGNFGYVYTADQSAVAEAEQQLADAQNALYNIGLEGANKYAESYAQTIQEMNDAVTELTEQWQNGEISSKEEYQQRMLELEEYYGEKLMQYSELHSIALQTDSRVAADAWTKDFAYMTTQTQKWMQNVDIYVQGVEASMDRYQQGIDRVEEYAGLDLDSLKTKTASIKDENKALAQSITEKDGLLDAMKAEIEQVDELTRKYAALRTEIQGTVDDYEALLQRMGVDIDTAAAGNPPFSSGDSGNDTGGNDYSNTGGDNSGGDDTTGGDDTSGTKTISVGGKINAGSAQIYDYAGDTSGERQYFRSDPVYNVLKESGDWIQVRHHKLSSGITGWFKKSDVTAMNTGGYTGDWAGSYGKLAFLHQKELVLNAQDTENLLASMDILDKIISTIDLYSSSAQLGGLLSSPSYSTLGNGETLEQNVHIEASFPSVTDHNEIEDALNNLINRASQYAHRN